MNALLGLPQLKRLTAVPGPWRDGLVRTGKVTGQVLAAQPRLRALHCRKHPHNDLPFPPGLTKLQLCEPGYDETAGANAVGIGEQIGELTALRHLVVSATACGGQRLPQAAASLCDLRSLTVRRA